MKFNLDNLADEYENLESQLSDPEIFKDQKKVRELSSRKKSLQTPVSLYIEYKNAFASLLEAQEIIQTETDDEFIELAKMQIEDSQLTISRLEDELTYALLPKDRDDEKNIIVEIRAAAGGDEASLFAQELSRAYMIFAENEGFKTQVTEENLNETGGIKEMMFEVKGE